VSTELLMGQDSSILIHVHKAVNLTEIQVFLNSRLEPGGILRRFVTHTSKKKSNVQK
jgi:hypothetical protein